MSTRLVLLGADDELRDLWRDELVARGHTVHAAHDLTAAIKLAQQHQPRVVLTTVRLPNLNGFHFVRSLRSVVDDDVKIIGVTEAVTPELSTGGFDLIVTQPIDFRALETTLSAFGDDPGEHKRTTRMRPLS